MRNARVRAQILAATAELVARDGTTGFRYEDVADVAGVHRASVYRHWPDREQLVAEAGLEDRVTFRVGSSAKVLSQLLDEGRRYDFALIDGGHQFAVAMLDFICVDRMLKVNGYVAIDDVGPNVSSKKELAGGPNRVLSTVFATNRYRVSLWSGNAAMCQKVSDV